MLQLVFPLDREASDANWHAWQDLHTRVHSQLNRILAGSEGGSNLLSGTRKVNTTAPLSGGGALSSDLTLSIAANGITNALLAQMPTNTLKGNNTAGTANAADLTASQAKTLLAISLTTDVSGTLQAAQFPALTGDVTTPGGSLATTITASAVTNSKLANMPANTIKGNNTGSTANAADLTVAQTKTLLAISLTTDVSGTLQAAQFPALTGDVTTSAGSLATTISANVVTNAKLAQMAANSIKGNNTGATANALDLTQTQVTAMLNVFTSTLQGVAPSSGGGTTNFLRADGTWAAPAYPIGANPSAAVGLSAVNGAATTFMRSDAAPALSQSIVPTWTGAHTFAPSGAGTTAITVNNPSGTQTGVTVNGSTGNGAILTVVDGNAGTRSWAVGVAQSAVGNFEIKDLTAGGASRMKIDTTGSFFINKSLGVNGNTPPSQVIGFGTPTGTGVIANFPGATATLAQCSQAIAQLITDLKNFGLYAA